MSDKAKLKYQSMEAIDQFGDGLITVTELVFALFTWDKVSIESLSSKGGMTVVSLVREVEGQVNDMGLPLMDRWDVVA